MYGPNCNVPSESSSTHELATNHDNQDEPQPQELEIETTSDDYDLQEIPEQSETLQDSTPSPVLRRSHRTHCPPDRYGQGISYPDCYTSNSDSDSWCEDAPS